MKFSCWVRSVVRAISFKLGVYSQLPPCKRCPDCGCCCYHDKACKVFQHGYGYGSLPKHS